MNGGAGFDDPGFEDLWRPSSALIARAGGTEERALWH